MAQDRVVLIGPVVAEILRGFRRNEQAEWAASRLRLAHYVETDWNDWCRAAQLGRKQASLGHDLPITDLVRTQGTPSFEATLAAKRNVHFLGVETQ